MKTALEEYIKTCDHSPSESEISKDKRMYEHEYPFLDKFTLIANVDRKTGKQYLIIKHNKSGRSNSLNCIHTALTKISQEEYSNIKDSEDIKRLYAKTSEGLHEVNLSPEERFYAFKSWVAGIAESGMDAFKIQSEIEEFARFSVPISSFLMKFIAQHDIQVLYDFLAKVERECMFEGSCHESSMIANLLPIINMIDNSIDENNRKIIKAILEINPPESLFLANNKIF